MERKTVPKSTLKVPINRRKLKETEKARRVTFYRNGDYFDAGVKVALRGSRPFPTLPHLLDYLSQKSRMPAKKLFAATDGRPIKSLEQLEDGAFYVISSDGKFESLPYGSVPPPKTSHVADALPVRQEDLQLFRPASRTLGKKKKKKKKEIEQLLDQPIGRREGRLLTIAAREGGARATLLFNDRNPPPFEDVLRDFGRALGLGHVHKMSTPSGRQVRSISQLKNEFQDVDTFFLDETSDDLSIADEKRLHYSPNRWKPPESKSAVSTRRSEIPVRKTEIRTSRLHLDWIGGELIVLDSGELVYAVGAAVVLYRRTDDSQRHYLDHTEDVCSLCVHPSGRMMASGQISSAYRGAAVNIWLVQSLQTIASVVRLAGNPISIAFSSHDFILLSIEAGQEEDCLTFWDWESDALLARVEMRKERLTGGAFHPQEPDLAATFGEHHLAFWRKRQDGLLARIDALSPGHSGRTILSWAFIGESSLAVGDSSGYLTLWALLPGDAFRILKEVRAHQSEVRSLLAMREGTLISGGDDQIKAWDSRQKLLHLETTGVS
ncbi:echinoderm microtubule-associated protein-like CG42247 [Stegodyphus dumicola]|uniref:echinoderm microtubule-associated protein-like CG42247 n=1 Tax=Stegodyphus dumicola TaxID=202533 RepID=UPI0015A8CDF3|nr:echinoderm microtubule-associated protein-like CG42247 [Stegodyphus dumicola]